jgi:hypothetical protein
VYGQTGGGQARLTLWGAFGSPVIGMEPRRAVRIWACGNVDLTVGSIRNKAVCRVAVCSLFSASLVRREYRNTNTEYR